jgi:hypothetical protein
VPCSAIAPPCAPGYALERAGDLFVYRIGVRRRGKGKAQGGRGKQQTHQWLPASVRTPGAAQGGIRRGAGNGQSAAFAGQQVKAVVIGGGIQRTEIEHDGAGEMARGVTVRPCHCAARPGSG